ncbi:putative transposase [Neisseria gonorrhoeae]|nr:putative transposase [Neisseria gonorrhoeae]
MKYRRFYRNGGTYFFTVVTNKRQKILTDDAVRLALRQAVMAVRERYPFEILAWVLMPDHLHTIWRLPDNDSAYSERWRQIKRHSQYLIGGNLRLWQNAFGNILFAVRPILPAILIICISIRSNMAM